MKMMLKYPVLIAIALLSFMPACRKDRLSRRDKKILYTEPTQSEIDDILKDWNSRNLTPTEIVVIEEHAILNDKFTLKIVSYRVQGIKEYAALLIPDVDSLVPVRMYVGGFGLDQTVNSIAMVLDSSQGASPGIFAFPALRGQSLEITVNGTSYTSPVSEGVHCDAFDGCTDDVLSLLNVVALIEEHADVDRTSVRGGSRGGTVALLAGIRDKRVKKVVDVVGPTDMLELTSQNEHDLTYECQFLAGLKNENATIEATRKKLIASSPYYFAKYLPLTQLHMGLKDVRVPIGQAHKLEQKMNELGKSGGFRLFTYDRTHDDIGQDNMEMQTRIEEFLSQP
ncbi:MAG: prolyl oligopeptidase family serine peptidase [Bacteroidota bacterium]